MDLAKGKEYQIEIHYKFEGNFPAIYIGCKVPDKINLFEQAKDIAKEVDKVVLLVGTNSDWETEGTKTKKSARPGEVRRDALAVHNKSAEPGVHPVLDHGRFVTKRTPGSAHQNRCSKG